MKPGAIVAAAAVSSVLLLAIYLATGRPDEDKARTSINTYVNACLKGAEIRDIAGRRVTFAGVSEDEWVLESHAWGWTASLSFSDKRPDLPVTGFHIRAVSGPRGQRPKMLVCTYTSPEGTVDVQ